jgi:PAS domain S-box-containing protein
VTHPEQALPSSAKKQVGWLRRAWISQGIQTKILVPLILLMLLSLLGSLVGYVLSTNATRNRIIDQQIDGDYRRVSAALAASESDVFSGAEALARSPDLPAALETKDVLTIDRQALALRDRFRLDQVLILDTDGQALINIVAQSYLSQIATADRERLLRPANGRTSLVSVGSLWLLVGSAPVFKPSSGNPARLATVYTFLNVTEVLNRYRRELGLISTITVHPSAATLSSGQIALASGVYLSRGGFRELIANVRLGDRELPLLISRSEAEINNILSSGLSVVLLSNALTLVLVLLIGLFLARGFARPIRKLSRVAQSVAAGDLAARSGMFGHDEIGQLGQAYDSATSTISSLLEQQARSAGELHAILQSIGDGVLAIDTDEKIVIINPTAAALLGRQHESLIGQPLSTLMLVDDAMRMAAMELIVAQVRGELTDAAMQPTEHTIAIGTRIVRLQSAPIRTSASAQAGAVVVIQDVTTVVEADRSKTEFIATASHELRTPLASIKGYIDLFQLLGGTNLNDQQRDFLKVMKRQADHMTALVSDLLEMARVDRGAVRVNPSWVALPLVLDEALTALHDQIGRRAVRVQTELADNLPAIWIDSQHLRRILANLLSNAVKYVQRGGWVRVRAYELHAHAAFMATNEQPWPHAEQRSLVIEVEDDGVGIRAEDQPKIFNRFFRSENPLSVEAGGTGLGLAITQALVEHNGGQIGFLSIEKMGSRFWVRLPISMADDLLPATPDSREVGSLVE